MPDIQINMLAIILAVIVNFLLGFDPDEKLEGKIMAKGMVIMVIGNIF